MNDDRELWACAVHMIREHQENVAEHLIEQVQAARDDDDSIALEFWMEVVDRVKQLHAPPQGPLQ